jgi:hypothetical protein
VEHDIQDVSLERFAAGMASREEARAITRHLLQGCPLCAQRLRNILRPSVAAADYGPALDAFVRACLGQPKEPEKGMPPSEPGPSPRKRSGSRAWQ